VRKPTHPKHDGPKHGDDRRWAAADFASLHGWPDHERDFFERAGDELRAWFRDAKATHRRAADHRGRGPIDHVRCDERIRDHVNDDLTEDRWIDASAIRVTVAGGEVTLTGRVEGKSARRRAEDLADAVPGVTHVRNDLRADAWWTP
jgi:osmotically-inducible protein OsmY